MSDTIEPNEENNGEFSNVPSRPPETQEGDAQGEVKPKDAAISGDAPELSESEWDDLFGENVPGAEACHSFKIEDQDIEEGLLSIQDDDKEIEALARQISTKSKEMMAELKLKFANREYKKALLNNLVAQTYPEDHKKLGDVHKIEFKPDGVYFMTVTQEEKREEVKKKLKSDMAEGKKAIAFATGIHKKEADKEKWQTTENAKVPLTIEEKELLDRIESFGVKDLDIDKMSELGADYLKQVVTELEKREQRKSYYDTNSGDEEGEPGESPEEKH